MCTGLITLHVSLTDGHRSPIYIDAASTVVIGDVLGLAHQRLCAQSSLWLKRRSFTSLVGRALFYV